MVLAEVAAAIAREYPSNVRRGKALKFSSMRRMLLLHFLLKKKKAEGIISCKFPELMLDSREYVQL